MVSTDMKIEKTLKRDLSRRIEEIIKVDQADQQTVYTELTEYVATTKIQEQYRTLLGAIAEAPSEPHEGIGVWVSGFFGSGKSSFAKNLGYVLANRKVLDKSASQLFKHQVSDSRCGELIDFINLKIPIEVVMFDVQTDKSSGGSGSSSISHLLYRSLLRTLDYAEDFDIAELEQSLEADSRLDEFVEKVEARYGTWRKRRKMAMKMSEASAVLHEMDPETYPSADSWAYAQGARRIEITPGTLVEKSFELVSRRRPGHALVFIVDEVGAYVARSLERIEELRKVVEQFGEVGKNMVKAGRAPAPVWLIVTSQEKLSEVVDAIDSKRVQLPRLQERFHFRIDMAPADIREIATRRVLSKNNEGVESLTALFEQSEGLLNERWRLERSSRKTAVNANDFVAFYPYPPHFVDLSISIMQGIRLQPGAARHLGGSNRTIIKQTFEMLASNRTSFADRFVGELVTLDLIYELVEGNLSSERRKDISDISERYGGGSSWEARVAKAICLLEFVTDLPRTAKNLAAVLYVRVGDSSPLTEVETAITNLKNSQFIKESEDGFKLQTASEKNWDSERRAIDPRPRDRQELQRQLLNEIFREPSLKTFRYRDFRSFKIGVGIDGTQASDGDIKINLSSASQDDYAKARQSIQAETREESNRYNIFWLFAISDDIDNLIRELHRSNQMISKYDQLRAQNKITPEESTCLTTEKRERSRIQNRLRDELAAALRTGDLFFRGVCKEGPSLGKTLSEVLRGYCEARVPELYSKLALGSRKLSGKEAEEVLKAANLQGLPSIFYGGDNGLDLVTSDGGNYVPNPNAPVVREVMGFIAHLHKYGEKVSGKRLMEKFEGHDYGWPVETLQVVLSVMLRAGEVEVIHQGRRFRNHHDPLCRPPFTKKNAFKAATFSPRESVGLKTLTTAADTFEQLTGLEVDIEEGAIAKAFQEYAQVERESLVSVLAQVEAHKFPGIDELREYKATLDGILSSATDDCVRILCAEGTALQECRQMVSRLKEALDPGTLDVMQNARRVCETLWPVLESRVPEPNIKNAVLELESLLAESDFYEHLPRIEELTGVIDTEYGALYNQIFEKRQEAYRKAMDSIKNLREWLEIPEEVRPAILDSLSSRVGIDEPQRPRAKLVCEVTAASIPEMEADIAAADNRQKEAFLKVQANVAPEERFERLKVSGLVSAPLDDEKAVGDFIEDLRARLLKLVQEGARVVLE